METVRCPACGEENPSRFRLCGYCGTSLAMPVVASVPCPACGSENPAGFRFCGYCGTLLDAHGAGVPHPGEPGWAPGVHGYPPGAALPPWAWWAVRWAPWPPPYAGPPGVAQPYGPPPGYGQTPYGPPGYPPAGYGPQGFPPTGYGPPGYGPPQPGLRAAGVRAAGIRAAPHPAVRARIAVPAAGLRASRPCAGAAARPARQPATAGVLAVRALTHAGAAAAGLPAISPPGSSSSPPAPATASEAPPAGEPGAYDSAPPAGVPPPVGLPPPASSAAPAEHARPRRAAAAVPEAGPPPAALGQAAHDPGRPAAGSAPAPFPGFEASAAPAALPNQEIRKVVTIIFSDLKGSTALTEKIDAEAINEVKERYFSAMATEITRHGGKIEKYIGDAIMAVFGLPRAHEDDALRAVRAAHGMTQALDRLNIELLQFYGVEIAARTGVNTGEVVANTDERAEQRLATGDAVNVAARLEQAAPANEVLIGEVTYDLVRAHVEVEQVEPLELKGKAERVPAYRLIDVRDTARVDRSPASEAQLVGRDGQLEQLRASLNDVAGRGGAGLATVLGEAGVGKTFLVESFQAEVRRTTTVLRGRCLPYGDGITFWPLVEIARTAVGIMDEDTPESALAKLDTLLAGVPSASEIRDRVGSVIGLTTTRFPVSEIFWGARRFLEALGARRPVVVCIEDVHNAETTFLDLIDHVLDAAAPQSAVLIVASGRPSLLDKRPQWAGRARHAAISVPALDPDHTQHLVEVLLGGAVDPVVHARVVATSDGNPLFVSQLVSMLVDKGLIQYADSRWTPTGDLDAAAVPPTIQALLAARLDDLSREERTVMEPASVIGLAFAQAAIQELVPDPLRPAVPQHLRTLDVKQFLYHDAASSSEDEIYRFRNLMIKDATYGSLLKRARAQLHERFVVWAERVNRERGREQEFEEILGYHLEQAYRYRTELGPIDAEGRAIAQRAVAKLGSAGRRAFARGDLPASASLLRRAIDLLAPDDRAWIETMIDLGEVLVEAGDFGEATAILDACIEAADALGDALLRARGRLGRLGIALYAEEMGGGAIAQALEEATATIPLFEAADDDAGLARAWRLIGSIHSTTGRYGDAAEAAQRVVDHGRRAGDTRLAARAAAGYATLARAGEMPVPELLARCGPLLEQVTGDRKAEAIILGVIAVAEAMQANFERARELSARAKAMLTELGPSVIAAATSIEGGRIELLAGDPVAAEALLREDADALEGFGERYFRSTVVGTLAHALVGQDRLADAEAAVALARDLTDEDDVESQLLWRTALAKIRARAGDQAAALELGEQAIALVLETDDIDVQGDAHADYAEVLTLLGRHDEAAAHYAAALELYRRKGNVTLAAAVERAIAGVPQGA